MVAFDAVFSATGQPNGAVNTITWTHVAGAGGTAAIIVIAWGSTSFPPTVTTATYDGNAMTLLKSFASGNNTAFGGLLVYGILGQATGSRTVVWTASASATTSILGNSMSFTGATAFGTAVANFNGASTTESVTVTGTTAGNLVAAAECHGTIGTNTQTTGTRRFALDNNSTTGAGCFSGSTTPGGGTVTPGADPGEL